MLPYHLFYWSASPLTVLAATKPNQTAATPPKLQSPATNPQALSASDCPLVGKFQGAVGVYAKNFKTGQVLVLNPDNIFAAASTIKVPVSVTIYRHFYNQADPDTRAIYDTGVELMMTISENDYFADFLDEIEENIGPDVIREHFSRLGMKNTTIRDAQARNAFGYSNVTTAQDMALIFEQLYLGKLISPEKTEFMLDAMAHSIFPDELARYMQQRKVIHKIGELDDVLADVGNCRRSQRSDSDQYFYRNAARYRLCQRLYRRNVRLPVQPSQRRANGVGTMKIIYSFVTLLTHSVSILAVE